jgi:hypothetical protein
LKSNLKNSDVLGLSCQPIVICACHLLPSCCGPLRALMYGADSAHCSFDVAAFQLRRIADDVDERLDESPYLAPSIYNDTLSRKCHGIAQGWMLQLRWQLGPCELVVIRWRRTGGFASQPHEAVDSSWLSKSFSSLGKTAQQFSLVAAPNPLDTKLIMISKIVSLTGG